MSNPFSVCRFLALTLTTAFVVAGTVAALAHQDHSLALESAKITIAGSSNIHDWTATTSDVRVVHVKVGPGLTDANFLDAVTKPGAFEAFEISIPVISLKSGNDGLDKNMFKALKASTIHDITFRATHLQAGTAAGSLKATGMLKVAGVEHEITFDLHAQLDGTVLTIKGSVPLVMTAYGVDPPRAMLGVLRTNPKLTVSFVAVMTVPPAASLHN